MLERIKMDRIAAIKQEISRTSQRSCEIIFHKFFISGLSGMFSNVKNIFYVSINACNAYQDRRTDVSGA